jgi:predicted RNase H-like HicB family nuclease
MRYYSFAIVIAREEEDPGFYAYSPTLPGCFSNGLAIEDTRNNMREAIRLHVAALIDRGFAVDDYLRLR